MQGVECDNRESQNTVRVLVGGLELNLPSQGDFGRVTETCASNSKCE